MLFHDMKIVDKDFVLTQMMIYNSLSCPKEDLLNARWVFFAFVSATGIASFQNHEIGALSARYRPDIDTCYLSWST